MIRFLKYMITAWVVHQNTRVAAAIAFYTLCSAAPLLVIGVGAAEIFVSREEVKAEILAQVAHFANPEVVTFVSGVLEHVKFEASGLISSVVMLLVMFYAASRVFVELNQALNVVFGIKPDGGRARFFSFVRERLVSATFVFSSGFVVVASLTTSTVLGILQRHMTGLLGVSIMGWLRINQLISFLVLFSVFLAFFRFLPLKKQPMRCLVPGVFASVILFEVGKYGISLYMSRSMVASAYGASGSVILVMIWIFYSAQILLLGAEVSGFLVRREKRLRAAAQSGHHLDEDGKERI